MLLFIAGYIIGMIVAVIAIMFFIGANPYRRF